MESLKSGSSEETIEHNIIVLMSRGYSENAAVKAAMRLARGNYSNHARHLMKTHKNVEENYPMKRNAVYENPLSSMQWYLVAAGVLGIGLVTYEMMKKPAVLAPAAANAITLQPGPMAATVGAGLTLNLPNGAVWAPGFPGAGTATPIQVPASPPAGQVQTNNLTYTDSTGTSQTTVLTLTS
jgi:hypothetical protein